MIAFVISFLLGIGGIVLILQNHVLLGVVAINLFLLCQILASRKATAPEVSA